MDVLIPYTQIHPQTVAGAPDDAVWADVSSDDHAYWRLLCDWWARGESFLVVEHDVVCRPDVVETVETCPEPWCVFKYDDMCHDACQEAWANMLGCTRFDASMIAAVPDAVSSIPAAERGWHNLCDALAGDKLDGMPALLRLHSLRAAGYSHHWHLPPVVHHHMGRNDIAPGIRPFTSLDA